MRQQPGLLIVGAVVAAIVVAMQIPGIGLGPSLDASVFSTVAWRLTEGDALYREIWDHKLPLTYLPYVLAQLATGTPPSAWVGVWLLSWASVVVAALVLRAVLLRAGVAAWPAALAAVLAAFCASAYLLSLGGGMSETFALLPMALALLAATRGWWLASGILAGLAILASVQAAPMLVAIAVLGWTDGGSVVLRRALLVAAGAAIVGALTLGGLALTDSLADASDAILRYGSAYRAIPRDDSTISIWSLVPWTVLVLLPLALGSGLAWVGRRTSAHRRLALASAAWLALGIVYIAFQGRFYAHYAIPLVVPMAVLTGLGVDSAVRQAVAGIGPSLRMLGLVLAGTVMISLVVGEAGSEHEQEPIIAVSPRISAVAAALETDAAGPGLLVWSNDARLYELPALAPAVRYPYLYPLITPGYTTEEMIADVLAQLEASPPTYVVDSGSLAPGEPGLPPLLIDRPVATDGRNLDLLDPLRAFVAERYELWDIIEGWPVYRLLRD